MHWGVQKRAPVETAVAVATGLLVPATLLWPDWIEVAFGVDPDHGSGTAEWAVVLILVATTLMASIAARRDWRRLRGQVE